MNKEKKRVHHTGLELLLDLYDCKTAALNDAAALERIMRAAVELARFDVVESVAHQFPHQGVTLVLILGQSHATLHTWPEARFVTADVYVCGQTDATKAALETIREHLVARFKAHSFSARLIKRGLTQPRQRL